MEFTNMDHITINVVDLEKTLWFYGELLELKSLPLVEFETETIYYFQLVGSIKFELINVPGLKIKYTTQNVLHKFQSFLICRFEVYTFLEHFPNRAHIPHVFHSFLHGIDRCIDPRFRVEPAE